MSSLPDERTPPPSRLAPPVVPGAPAHLLMRGQPQFLLDWVPLLRQLGWVPLSLALRQRKTSYGAWPLAWPPQAAGRGPAPPTSAAGAHTVGANMMRPQGSARGGRGVRHDRKATFFILQSHAPAPRYQWQQALENGSPQGPPAPIIPTLPAHDAQPPSAHAHLVELRKSVLGQFCCGGFGWNALDGLRHRLPLAVKLADERGGGLTGIRRLLRFLGSDGCLPVALNFPLLPFVNQTREPGDFSSAGGHVGARLWGARPVKTGASGSNDHDAGAHQGSNPIHNKSILLWRAPPKHGNTRCVRAGAGG